MFFPSYLSMFITPLESLWPPSPPQTRFVADLRFTSLSFLGLLIYASVIFHRFRKGTLEKGAYAPTARNGQQLLPMGSSYPMPGAQQYGQDYTDRSYYNREMGSRETSVMPGMAPHSQAYLDTSYGNQYKASHEMPTASSRV